MRSDNMIDQLCIRKKFPLLNMSWFSFAGVQFWSRGKSHDQNSYFGQIKCEHFSYVWNEFTEVWLRILNKESLD